MNKNEFLNQAYIHSYSLWDRYLVENFFFHRFKDTENVDNFDISFDIVYLDEKELSYDKFCINVQSYDQMELLNFLRKLSWLIDVGYGAEPAHKNSVDVIISENLDKFKELNNQSEFCSIRLDNYEFKNVNLFTALHYDKLSDEADDDFYHFYKMSMIKNSNQKLRKFMQLKKELHRSIIKYIKETQDSDTTIKGVKND